MSIRLMLSAVACAATAVLSPLAMAQAQDYPSRTIRIVEPFPPGGGTDAAARIIAQKLSDVLKQQVIVDNRAGAAGAIGAEHVARSAPDGYTILMGNSAVLSINPSLYKDLKYNPVKDFKPIIQIANYPYIVVSRPDLPVKTLGELIELAKSKPNGVNFASSGSTTRVIGAMVMSETDVKMTDVPFNGTGPALNDLLGGHVDWMFASSPLAQFKTGQLRPLAVTGKARSKSIDDVPTVAEAGFPQITASAWYGFLAPAGTPDEIVNKLNTAMVEVLKDAEVQEKLNNAGVEIVASTPEAFGTLIAEENKRWADVVEKTGFKIE